MCSSNYISINGCYSIFPIALTQNLGRGWEDHSWFLLSVMLYMNSSVNSVSSSFKIYAEPDYFLLSPLFAHYLFTHINIFLLKCIASSINVLLSLLLFFLTFPLSQTLLTTAARVSSMLKCKTVHVTLAVILPMRFYLAHSIRSYMIFCFLPTILFSNILPHVYFALASGASMLLIKHARYIAM